MKKIDTKEFEIPETLFIRDIENKVLQGIVLQTLSRIDGIGLVEGNFFDTLWTKGNLDGVKGIQCNQDGKKQCVSIRVEINVRFGVQIPQKAEEVQNKVSKEIMRLTGLHVSSVHVVFKGMVKETPSIELEPAQK